jgi:extracellular elastinolytic metalloproteinase
LTAGNTVALHLFIDAFSLQPCNPTFITARAGRFIISIDICSLLIISIITAIIQADANRYAGANKCTLWKAFAKRGLGNGEFS